MNLSDGVRGGMFGLAAFGTFATHDAIVKLLADGISIFQITFFAALFGNLWIWLTMRSEGSFSIRPVHPWWIGFRSVATVVTGICAFYAFSHLPMAEVYAILFSTPLVITALSIPWLGERVGWPRWGAIFVGLGGVFIVLQPGASPLTLAHLAALVAVLSGAIVAITLRIIGPDERNGVLLFYPNILSLVLMSGLMPVLWITPSATQLGLTVMMSFLGFVALMCLIAAYRRAPASVVAPMQYSQIIWASLFGALFFNDPLQNHVVLGAAVVIASGIFVLWRESRASAG